VQQVFHAAAVSCASRISQSTPSPPHSMHTQVLGTADQLLHIHHPKKLVILIADLLLLSSDHPLSYSLPLSHHY